jgi:hypothetical protein
MIAAVLVWSVLFADLLRRRVETGSAQLEPRGQLAGRDLREPAPVTTRTS